MQWMLMQQKLESMYTKMSWNLDTTVLNPWVAVQ